MLAMRERLHISYGPIEVNDEIAPVLRIIESPWNPYAKPLIHEQRAFRKRRLETWWENGQKMGRWDWVPADQPETDAST